MTISKKISSKAVLRIVPYVKDLIARIQADGERRVEQARHRLLLRPSREDVFHAFRLILGREPENDSAIVSHLGLASVSELRLAMLKSQEFWERYISIHAEVTEHPNVHRARRTVVFIHFQKTGGTSFRKLVEHNFPSERRCPILD